MRKWLAGGLLFLLLASFVGVYYFAPAIIIRVAFELAARQGFDLHEFVVQRPQLGAIRINKVAGDFGDIRIVGADIDVSYHLEGLLATSVDAIKIRELQIRVNVPEATAAPIQTADVDGIDPAILFGIVPRLDVEELVLEIVQADFVGTGSLKLDSDNAVFELSGVRPDFASNLSLSGRVQSNNRLQFSFFDKTEPDRPFLQLNAISAANDIDVTGDFDLSGYPLSLVTGLLGLPKGTGRVQGELASKLDSFAVNQIDELLDLNGSFQLDWQNETVTVKALRGQLSGSPTSMILTLAGGNIDLPESAVRFTVGSGTIVQYVDDQISIGAGMTAFLQDLDNLTFQTTLTRTAIDLRHTDIRINTDAKFVMTGEELQTRGDIAADILLPPSGVAAGLNIKVGKLGLPLQINYDSARNRAEFSGSSRWSADNLGRGLAQKWPYNFDLVSGDVDLEVQGVWRDGKLNGRARVALGRGTVRYDEYIFLETASDLDFVFDDGGLRLLPSIINVGNFDFGLAMSNAEMKVAWQDDVVDIYSGRFDLLGGRVTVEPTQYHIEENRVNLNMSVLDVDLAKVLALEGDDIKGEGRLSGTLPIRINNGEVSMHNGQIRASDAGGVIQVSPKFTLGTGQPGIDFAMKALTNFSYKTLTAVADYEENGDLKLAVSLQGHNPEIEKGRPIHYNLNISENIISLLDALNAESGVTERVERGVMKKKK